jgi:hypothetical protein
MAISIQGRSVGKSTTTRDVNGDDWLALRGHGIRGSEVLPQTDKAGKLGDGQDAPEQIAH